MYSYQIQKYLHLSENSNFIILFCFSAELALKARREIADYIAAGKEDRARIRVRFWLMYMILMYHVCEILGR